jgi:hypothetical protein
LSHALADGTLTSPAFPTLPAPPQGKVGDQQMTITQHLQTIANLQAVIGTQQQMLSQLQGMMQQLQFQHTNAAVHASTAAMLR